MLEPQNRLGYLEQLLPPEGFTLDMALGTTYSLDLLALLIAPLSMALFDCEDKNEALSSENSVAILEALRRTKDRMVVFCQKGRISVPGSTSTLFSYLEPIVIEVEPPNPGGAFHPKIWLLRFVAENKSIMYRFICLSRNLTFDQSWDTALVLEGEYQRDRVKAYGRNRPLSDFVAALPGLATLGVNKKIKDIVKTICDEVLRTDFQFPEGFEDFRFHPLGIDGTKPLKFEVQKRFLVVSPFLTEQALAPLQYGNDNVLISRAESLDMIDPEHLRKIQKNSRILVLDSEAEKSDATDNENDHAKTMPGLHAKLYINEVGWDAHFYTGSANATVNGLNGVNVEFVTELVGKASRVGIRKIVGEEDGEEASFINLLVPYDIPETKVVVDGDAREMEKVLDDMRRKLASAGMRIDIETAGDNNSLILNSSLKKEDDNIKIYCRPVTLPPSHAKEVGTGAEEKLVFTGLDVPILTSFIAFRVEIMKTTEKKAVEFVLNLPAKGMPEGRHERILCDIVNDGEKFVRYLFFLMADSPDDVLSNTSLRALRRTSDESGLNAYSQTIPIFEELVRLFSRCPEKILEIGRLIEDMKKIEEGKAAMPEGFEELWSAFKTVAMMGAKA